MNDISIALLIGHESRTTFRADRPARQARPAGPSLATRLASRLGVRRAPAPAALPF